MESSTGWLVCPSCGARNAADSRWCGQCYQSFGAEAESPEVPEAPPRATDGRAGDGPPDPPGGPADGPATVEVPAREWECGACGSLNQVEASRCARCGTDIFTALGIGAGAEPAFEASTAVGWSIVFPGLGHARVGQGLLGAAIGLLVATTLVFAMVVGLVLGRMRTASLLLVMAMGLWAVAALDTYQWASGHRDEVLLRPRVVSALAGVVLLVFLFGLAQGLAAMGEVG